MMKSTSDQRPGENGRDLASRRTFLRGVGVTMALPWLESVPALGASTAAALGPKRFAALFMGCGVNPTRWWAKGAGADMELGRCLEPLAALKAKINVINGLFSSRPRALAFTLGRPGTSSRGQPLQKGAELKGDQRRPDAGPAPGRGDRPAEHGPGAANSRSPATTRRISRWHTARTSPGRVRLRRCRWRFYPSLAFDSLFDNRGSRRNQSVLDRVRDEATGLSRRVSARRPGEARRVPDQRPRGRAPGGPDADRESPGRGPRADQGKPSSR